MTFVVGLLARGIPSPYYMHVCFEPTRFTLWTWTIYFKAKIIFGLNALIGKLIHGNPASEPWITITVVVYRRL